MFSSSSNRFLGLSAGLALVLGAVGCGGTEQAPAPPPSPQHVAMFQPLPEVMESATNPITDEKINLGRKLYYDTRLSKNQDISCNTCHLLDQWGVDGKPTSAGHGGQLGPRNSPTVYNAAGHIAQFWDGREPDVEAQAKGPILNPVEMAMPSEEAVVRVLKSIPGYVEEFAAAFPGEDDPVTYDNLAKAIGAFERKLVTPSRFDAYLKGDGGALTATERRGLDKFIEVGCTTCHMGPYLGGNLFQKMGLVEPYPTEDEGRFAVTGNEAEKFFFKVPSLRNVEKTGPYMHDGSLESLDEVVAIMGRYQLGKTIKPDEVMDIVAFLKSLTGDLPMEYIAQPELPASGPDTPGPDPS
ncbi:MAG: cytochrome-c peroxidase [Acidobacteriota bacterium]|nr:cytochrome-c peroxidase [Acidobacteriota bacterium]